MRHSRGTIWTERALMVLFLASLAGALNLVMAVHRRAAATRSVADTVSTPSVQLDTATTNVPASDPRPPSVSASTIVPTASPRKAPSPPPEDPTKKALAELAATTAQEIEAARQADRRTESLEKARRDAVAESERWRRREMLVKQQVSALADRARKIDKQMDTLAAERDALARESRCAQGGRDHQPAGQRLPRSAALQGPQWKLASADRHGMLQWHSHLTAQGADVLDARSVGPDQSPVQSGHSGPRSRAASHADVRVSRRGPGGTLFRLPRPAGRYTPVLRDPCPAGAAGNCLRL